jgi:hypothetical protein
VAGSSQCLPSIYIRPGKVTHQCINRVGIEGKVTSILTKGKSTATRRWTRRDIHVHLVVT